MTALGGTMGEHAPANLPRSLLNFALTILAFALLIISAVMLLHAPTITIYDLAMFLPSAVLFLTPYLTILFETALGLPEFASIVFGLLMASLCTGLYAIHFHPAADTEKRALGAVHSPPSATYRNATTRVTVQPRPPTAMNEQL